MFWKKRKDQPKEIGPSTYQKEDRIAEAILSLKYTVANNSDAQRKQERREDIGNKLLQVATLFFVVLTTIGIFRQAHILNNTDAAVHESATAAKNAADAAKSAVEATRDQTRLDQRAWLGLESLKAIPNFPEIGKSFGAEGLIRNTGKTPALNVVIYSVIEPVLAGNHPNFSYVGIKSFGAGMISPNGSGTIPFNPLIDVKLQQPAIFTQEMLDMLKNGAFNVYPHGRIEYDDIFGNPHWMTYCSYLPVPSIGGFAHCDEHEDTDDNQKTKK